MKMQGCIFENHNKIKVMRMRLIGFVGLGLLIIGLTFGPAALGRAGEDRIAIGLVASLSESAATVGQSQRNGATMAVEDLNRAGGVWLRGKWQKLALIPLDDKADPARTAELARKLIKDDVEIIIGGSIPQTCLALNLAAGRKFLYLSVGPAPEEMFRKKTKARTALGLAPSIRSLGRGAGALALRAAKGGPVICLAPDDKPGREFAAGFKAGAGQGVAILRPTDRVGSAEKVKKAMGNTPGLIVLGSTGDEAVREATALDRAGLPAGCKIMFGRGAAEATGPEAGRLIQAVWPPSLTGWPDAETANTADAFANRYAERFRRPADGWAAAGYGAVKEAIRAVGLANSTSARKTYRALMHNRAWKGPQGPARWRSDGRAAYKYPTWLVEVGGDKSGARVMFPADGKDFLPPVEELGY